MGQVVSFGRMVLQHILSYFIKKVPISGTSWISSSIHHISLERDSKGSGSGGLLGCYILCNEILVEVNQLTVEVKVDRQQIEGRG
jgi:hypothetical protein